MQGAGGITQHLRTRQGRGRDVAEDMKKIKSVFMVFLLIFASVYLNFLNLTRKRRRSKFVAPIAILALILDIVVLITYPLHVVFPLVVVLSTAAVKISDSIRATIFFPSLVFSFIIVLVNSADSTRPAAELAPMTVAFTSAAVSAVLVLVAQRLVMRFPNSKNPICGLLTCYSVLETKSLATIALTLAETPDIITSIAAVSLGVLGLVLARRFISTVLLSQFSVEYSSWSLMIIAFVASPVWVSAEGGDAVTLALSGAIAFMIRFMAVTPQTDSRPISDDPGPVVPLPLASSTVARSRKAAPLPTIELGRLDDPTSVPEEFKHSEFAVAVPWTAETSSVSEDPTIPLEHFVEMDIDEDELFNKISNSNV